MIATLPATRADRMASTDQPDQGTKTVRVAASAATKLQTIAALKDQMGVKFKPIEFLNGLIEKPVDDLYAATVREFTEFQSGGTKKPKK